MDTKRIWLTAAALYLAAMASISAFVWAEDRTPGSTISDRIRSRMEKRRTEQAPVPGLGPRQPGVGPGYESLLIGISQTRTFMRYTPNSVLISGKKAPVVFALHGGKGTADRLQGYLGLNAVADRDGFIAVYPQGLQNVWNDGRKTKVKAPRQTGAVDDVAFLNGLADALVTQGIADPDRIYLMGVSNGGFMTLRMACEGSSRFAGFGAVIASLPLAAKETCKPGRPLPVVMINGTDDTLIRFDGKNGRFGILGNMAPPDAAAFIAGLDGCGAPVDTHLATVDSADTTRVAKRVWSGCKPGSAVEFVTVKGGGHQPPSTKSASGIILEMFLGSRSHQIDTAETMWDFFQRTAK